MQLISSTKQKNSDIALEIYDKMKQLGVSHGAAIYIHLADIYSAKGLPDKILEVYDIYETI